MKSKLFLPLLVISLLLTDCQKKVLPEPGEKSLKFAIQQPFDKNYHPVEDAGIINYKPLLRSLFSTLYKMDQNLKPHPFLIEREEKNGNKIVFYLKKKLKFSNGQPITAADVVWSIKNCIKYKLIPNPFYRLIEGGEKFFSGECPDCPGIKVLTPTSFQIIFNSPVVEFSNYLSNSSLAVIPRGWTRGKKIFSGAYILEKEEKKADHVAVTIKKNPYYIGNHSKLEKVTFCFYETRDLLDASIKKGEPDLFLYNYHFNTPESDYEYQYFKTPLSGHFLFLLNPNQGIFKNKEYRTFLKNYLVQTDFSKRENWNFATRANKILPYGLTGYFIFPSFQPEDLSLLMPKQKIDIRCFYVDSGIRRSLFSDLKESLKQYNINLELNHENWPTLTPRLRDGDFDLTAFYYMVDLPNSFHFYESLMYLSGDLNPMGYQNPRTIELLSKYRNEPSEFKRLKILAQLETIAQDEAYVVPILNYMCLLGYKKKVKNVSIDTFLTLPFEEFDIETRN